MTNPYRDDDLARATRLVSLLNQLEQCRAQIQELKELEKQTAAIEAEIEVLRGEMNADVPKKRASLLDYVKVASPCSADWGKMQGDERVRFCSECKKNVYNISALSREEAENFVLNLMGDTCIRIYRRDDGTLITDDCSVGVSRKRRLRVLSSLAGGGLAVAGYLAWPTSHVAHAPCEEQIQPREVVTPPPVEPRPAYRKTVGVVAFQTVDLAKERRLNEQLNVRMAERKNAKDTKSRQNAENAIRQLEKELRELRESRACKPGDPMCGL